MQPWAKKLTWVKLLKTISGLVLVKPNIEYELMIEGESYTIHGEHVMKINEVVRPYIEEVDGQAYTERLGVGKMSKLLVLHPHHHSNHCPTLQERGSF